MSMPNSIEYYFSPISGYAYLGHRSFLDIARCSGFDINYYPIDITRVFTATGTTPPANQSEARKSYRYEDMARCANLSKLPINTKPKYWPAASTLACKAIIASKYLDLHQSEVSGTILEAVWVLNADISDAASLCNILENASFPGIEILECCESREVNEDLNCFTNTAIEKGIFGSPTYIFNNERFWGQDRLTILSQRLALHNKYNVSDAALTN